MIVLKYFGIFLLFVVASISGMIWLAPTEISFQVNEEINAPIHKVYEATSQPQYFGKWITGVKNVDKNDHQEPKVGAEYKVNYKGKGNMVLQHRVNVLDPNTRYAYTGEVADFMQVTSDTRYESVDSTTTRIYTKVSMKALSTKMKLLMYMEDTHKANSAQNYKQLKMYLEMR